MRSFIHSKLPATAFAAFWVAGCLMHLRGQAAPPAQPEPQAATSSSAADHSAIPPPSAAYSQLQSRLAQGWNTWDVNSVTTQVLLPEGLAIHVGLRHNTTAWGSAFLRDVLIGRLDPGAEVVVPGPHSWDGSYTDVTVSWKEHKWRVQTGRDGSDVVLLATPLPSKANSALPATVIFSVGFLWNRPGTATRRADVIEAQAGPGRVKVYCTCAPAGSPMQAYTDIPVAGPYFSADFISPVAVSTGKRRTLGEIQAVLERQQTAYSRSTKTVGSAATANAKTAPIVDAIETTLGWDTIYDPGKHRVISPVSRVWCLDWGGYVLFDWDTFFAATLAGIGDKQLAYANAIEILREETPQGFVPNYARPGKWKSFDRSEPPVGAITVLGLYQQYHDRWFLEDTFEPLLKWNRWWSQHRDIQGYLAWGSDGNTTPTNLDDHSIGTRQGAIYESGLDNSPMYDTAAYDPETHLLEYADVGLMSMYIADCDALAQIADALAKPAEAKELRDRSARYKAKLETLWNDQAGIFLNKDLKTGEFNLRLSPTNFYPMLADVATPQQARTMIQKHLLNAAEFEGEWVIPSIARNDPAFKDQNYWRGRIWGPMNYLVYLGLIRYDDAGARREFAQKSYSLFLKEWSQKGHVHENYNAMLGTGDDVANSDRFYHWGALLGYVEYLEESSQPK